MLVEWVAEWRGMRIIMLPVMTCVFFFGALGYLGEAFDDSDHIPPQARILNVVLGFGMLLLGVGAGVLTLAKYRLIHECSTLPFLC